MTTIEKSYVPKSKIFGERPGYWPSKLTPGMITQTREVTAGEWSPDGKYLYYTVGYNARSDIYRLNLEDGSTIQVTGDVPATPLPMMGQMATSHDFSLSPDGSQIAFTSEKDGKIHLISSEGGVSKLLALGDPGQGSPIFSPDGSKVAFTYLSKDLFGIAVADAAGNQWPRLVSSPDFFSFAPRWFPDSKKLVYLEYDSHRTFFYENRLVMADLETGQTKILSEGLGKDLTFSYLPGNYAPSPDGKYLAYISEESGWANLYLLNVETGQSFPLVQEAAEHHNLHWSPDSTRIAYLKHQGTSVTVNITDLNGEHFALEEGNFVCSDQAWSPDGTKLSFTKQNSYTPPNIWLYDLTNRKATQLTKYNIGGLAQAGLVEAETIHWQGSDGLEIEGLLLKPEKVQPGKHPMLLYVHGGPMGQYNQRWDPHPQYWVSKGWVVVQPNFRGSTGYGRAFRKALFGTWGDMDMQDSMGGIDYANNLGLIDPSRVVAWGLSNGGYATMRLVTGWPERFKAGVALAGLSNLESMPDQTDRAAAYIIEELLGVRSENLETYRQRSGVNLAHQLKAPLLILEGDVDARVPKQQGEEMVAALQKAGKTDFERHVYEGEGHGWRKISSTLDYIERMEKFLTKWVLER
ncbi:MAG: S9 family peptidase [Chloroflexi bacterium]|nr:S9 family peptidase [Chloroflexota bacterium]OJV95882.1 MAG: hypothetical protein BGO39_21485 [Chloroflexi bacterium 54-19]